ncbi:MAG: SDR family NAD(P)-dependent oxidoreductase [Deltaproteobacteria bacterium]|nr:SDR family NAD(P)-dependent oxidoreductase [Deltaproteobacteria bacterium]
MSKTIVITGSTDGIGRATAQALVSGGHHLVLHGRNPDKLQALRDELSATSGSISTLVCDLSRLADVGAMAQTLAEQHPRIDVLINNAGVFRTSHVETADGLDVRFVVNTIAPYLLTQRLRARLDASSRVVNLSSAAQAPVDLDALAGPPRLSDSNAYAQSKLAITAWSGHLARSLGPEGPMIVSVNPGSMLGTKMVKDAYGVAGADIRIGADILVRAALDDEFAGASGRYYDNDARRFGPPHPEALDDHKAAAIVSTIESVLSRTA